jgi:lipopolysaccharide transport system ATP-binding protein
MSTVISVENLSKAYRLGQIGTGTFTNDMKLWWAKMFGKPNPLLRIGETDHGNRDGETGWALKDVSFTVEQGEVLGIIGRNGAGKSTLLKILSRVTAPTSGKITGKGRIASLLEVGTGFHPELTGRENIYLNGAILGMSRKEIDRKFDEIVDFAEVEKFIDTPVKRYSSGMYVRLAFAVAAHLEPEILVVDEVLAVGDAEFQKRCLGKMRDVAEGGRTVLFVSHNMSAVNQLCSKAILLRGGVMNAFGNTQNVVSEYLRGRKLEIVETPVIQDLANSNGRITSIRIEDQNGNMSTNFGIGEHLTVRFMAKVPDHVQKIVAGLEISSLDGHKLLNLRSDSQGIVFDRFPDSANCLFFIKIPGLPLYPGVYVMEPWYAEYRGKRIDQVFSSIKIAIHAQGLLQSERLIQPGRGIILLDCEWKAESFESNSELLI